jgi:hypothetical protein
VAESAERGHARRRRPEARDPRTSVGKALAAFLLVAALVATRRAGAAPPAPGERGSPEAVPDEIADLWTEALVERYAIGGGRVVVSEKPGAPDAAVCVAATYFPGNAATPMTPAELAGVLELELRGGTEDPGSGAHARARCTTFPAGELALGIWLVATRIRNWPKEPRDVTPVVTSEGRAAALAMEGARTDGPILPRFAIAVSGGVAATDVVALVEKAFAGRADHADITRISLGVHQTTERLSMIEAPVPAPRARYGFIATGDARERAALAVVVDVLAGGESSRLPRDLVVRRFLAHSVSPWVTLVTGGALFGVDFEISTRTSLDRARRFIDGAVKQLRLVGPSRGELRRARVRLERRALLQFENPTERAKMLSLYELTQGDARAWFEENDAVRTLTEENVRKVAHDGLVDARRTTVETYPPLWPEDDPKLAQYRTYTVEPGDTLSGIALRFGIPLQDIARANDLDPRYRLTTGQSLLIPP